MSALLRPLVAPLRTTVVAAVAAVASTSTASTAAAAVVVFVVVTAVVVVRPRLLTRLLLQHEQYCECFINVSTTFNTKHRLEQRMTTVMATAKASLFESALERSLVNRPTPSSSVTTLIDSAFRSR